MTRDISIERRSFGRRQTNYVGRIKISGRPTLTCTVRNLSEAGALLVFQRPESLPYGFVLNIDGEPMPYGCEIRHHFGERVGVSFVALDIIQDYTPAPGAGELADWSRPRRVQAAR